MFQYMLIQNILFVALSDNLDVSYCLNEKLSLPQMDQIIKGLKSKVDVSIYANPEIDWEEMKEIRENLENERIQ